MKKIKLRHLEKLKFWIETSKNVPHPKKVTLAPRKNFLTSKGPPSISAKNEDLVEVSWFCSLPLSLRSLNRILIALIEAQS